jgi:uncharacterized protein (TIGR02147 family)
MVNETHLPDIFGYNDFRRFLRDCQKARRATDRAFTKSAICKRMGLPKTRSYLNDVLNGKHVTATFVERFAKAFGLKGDEARFFRVLVQFNQASNAEEREMYFEQIIGLNRTPRKVVDPAAYAFYKEWHHGVIRALLDVFDFRDDYTALAKRVFPAITARKAKDSIALLKRLGLIRQDSRGYYKPTDKSVSTGPYVRDELVRQYQVKTLELAKNAVVRNHRLPQNISTNTLSVSEEGYRRLEKRLQEFKSEIRSLVHKDDQPASRVYQLNIQLFPSSK